MVGLWDIISAVEDFVNFRDWERNLPEQRGTWFGPKGVLCCYGTVLYVI